MFRKFVNRKEYPEWIACTRKVYDEKGRRVFDQSDEYANYHDAIKGLFELALDRDVIKVTIKRWHKRPYIVYWFIVPEED